MPPNLLKNSLSGSAQFLVSTLLILSVVPFFIRTLGVEAYGLFSLVALVGSVNTFANLGLNAALVRFLAEQGKTTESDHDIVVNFALVFIVAGVMVGVGLLFQDEILTGILGVPGHWMEDAQWLFRSMLGGAVLILLGQTFTGIMDAQQKMYLTNLLQLLYNILYWTLVLVSIFIGYALKGIAVAIFVAAVLWFCSVVAGGLRSWGNFSFRGLHLHGWRVARKQLGYGLQIYSSGVVGFLHEPMTKILVSRFIGIAEVGFFDIGLRAKNQVVGLLMKLLAPLYPALSAEKDMLRARSLVHNVGQKAMLVMIPSSAIVLLVTQPMVRVFFDSHVEPISTTISAIVVAYLIASVPVVPMYYYLTAKDRAANTIVVQAVNVVVNAVVFVTTYSWLGYHAAVVSTVLAITASFPLLLYYQWRYLGSLMFESWKQALSALLVTSILLTVVFGLLMQKMTNWGTLAGGFLIVLMSVLLYRYFEVFDKKEFSLFIGGKTAASKLLVRLLCKDQRL
jgi:O-antigen/teichoic acid export membrane protein